MRLLHIAHGWPPQAIGGTELYAAALLQAQQDLGIETRYFVPDPAAKPARAFLPLRRGWQNTRVEKDFGRVLKEWRPEVVHFHHLTGLSMRLPALAKAAGVKVVFSLHDWWLDCARGQRVNAQGERCSGASPLKCAQCLAPRPVSLWGPLLSPLLWERQALQGQIQKSVDLWLSPSQHLAQALHLPAQHLPLPLLYPVPLSLPKEGPLRLRFVGALIPTKGPQIALHAFQALPKGIACELQLIGPELPYNGRMDYLATLKQKAQTLGVRIRSCQPSEMPAIWAETDILLFPSLWEENSPSVLREAAAAGIPILSSDLQGAREICTEATFIAPNDGIAWEKALRMETQRGRRRCVPQQFPNIQMHARQVIRCYEDILRRR